MNHLLNIIIFFPAFAALLLCVLRGENIRIFAIIVSALELFFTFLLWNEFNSNYEAIQFSIHYTLIQSFRISYFVGIDGISLFLLILNALITFFAIYFFKHLKTHLVIAILFLESIVMGVFSSLDVILFYIFWELSMLPVLYIIGVWGGANKVYATIKYFIYAFGSSLIMLIGILYYAYQYKIISGMWSFNLLDWYEFNLDPSLQNWLFVAFFIGVAVKIPLFPFHSWQAHAYTQAPIIGSALLAGVLSKMGTYAILRFILPLFPITSSDISMPIAILCVFMVIYGAMVAYAQKDIKTLFAYASISHMGIIVLGIFSLQSEGLSGAVFFMIAHGVIVASLFLLVGVFYERIRHQDLTQAYGLAHSMPQFSTIFGIVMMSSLGLPLTMGFVGEVLCLYGFFQVNPILAFLAGTSFFVGAIYMLNLYKKIFFGNNSSFLVLKDLGLREKIVFVPVVAILIGFGIYPKPLLDSINTSVNTLVKTINSKQVPNLDMILDIETISTPLPPEFDEKKILIIPNIGE